MATSGNTISKGSNSIAQALTTASADHPLEAFFGPYQGTSESLRADDQLAHETYNLPKAYQGKNKFLEEVLDFKIRKEDEFYTRDLLPWEYTDDLHVAWEIFSFNRTLADLEPHQGVPRYVSAQSEAHTDNLLRRGLAFIIEHGFYKTQRGKRHFSLNLQQISDAVHTTCYFGVIHAILSGQNYYKEWQRRFGRQSSRRNELFSAERRRWACVQKEENGLYLLDAELKHEMRREGVSPNLWVFPDKMGIYVNMVGEHQLDYNKRGPEANSNRERGDQKATFRGLPVFEAQSFDVDFTGNPVDLMIRQKQCGEWFWCPIRIKGAANSKVIDNESSQVAIYSADSDNFEIIKAEDYVDVSTAGKVTVKALKGYAKGGDKSIIDGRSAVNAAGDAYNANNPDNQPWVNLDVQALNKNGEDDLGILLMRPCQTYRMASAILAKGGNETGSTFHGHHDFMLSDDIVRKVHVGHYTFYSKSVVKRPKNYVIVEDVFSQGYVGGEGTVLHSKDSFQTMVQEGSQGETPESLVAVLCSKRPKDHVLDITGRFAPSVYETYRGRAQDEVEEHYQGSHLVYETLMMDRVDMYKTQDTDEFLSRVKRMNTVCWRGMEMKYDAPSQQFVPTQLNTGHWGPNVYPGVKKVRMGENSFMQKQNYGDRMVLRAK
tara:strand:- start:1655 stop:3631 length:1977 start_codon:yes stop_codon:yes gene_type:complete